LISRILTALRSEGILESDRTTEYLWAFVFRARVTILLSSRARRSLMYAIKMSDRRDFAPAYERMARAYRFLPEAVPEPLRLLRLGSHQLLVARGHHVHILENGLTPNDTERREILATVLEVLARLHGQTVERHERVDSEEFRGFLRTEIDAFEAAYGNPTLVGRLRAHCEALMERYPDLSFPVTAQHGDLAMANVGLLGGDPHEVMILDWDDYSEVSLPVYDLFTFVWSFVGQYFGDLYTSPERLRFVRDEMERYCATLGIPFGFAADLYPICITLYAKLQRRVAAGRRILGEDHAIEELTRYFDRTRNTILD